MAWNPFRRNRAMPSADSDRRRAQTLVERGIAAEASARSAEALGHYREAVAADGGYAPAHMNLGIALQATGDLDGAFASYRQATALDPQYAAAHYNLALMHLIRQENVPAERAFRAALQFRNEFPEAWVGLATALEALGRDDEALAALETAIAERGDYAGAFSNASALLRKAGRLEAAADYQRRAVLLEPEDPGAHWKLGTIHRELGQLSEAEAAYRHALALDPDLPDVQVDLALLLQSTGRRPEALTVLFDAVARGPANAPARPILAQALHGYGLTRAGPTARKALIALCMDDGVSMISLTPTIIGLLSTGDAIQSLQRMARQAEAPFASLDPAVSAFLCDSLLLAALPRMPMADVVLEEVLTYLRRCMLLRFDAMPDSGVTDPAVTAEFSCALARQCFLSNYAFYHQEDELQRIAIVRESIETALRHPVMDPRALEPSLTMFALYEPLHILGGSGRLLDVPMSDWTDAFSPIVQEQLVDRRREREIGARIPAITTIEDGVSLAVRDQYEQNPYPRWVSVHRSRVETIEDLWRRLCPDRPVRTQPRPVHILIAGCGTGRHPIQLARMYPDSEILAVDLSLASLAYASRMTDGLGIGNIRYRQADILKLGRLDRRFAIVDSSGVLHHLRDPMEGWRILVDLMEPDGLMRIALYSDMARSDIRAAREYLESVGLPRNSEGVRRGRHAIIALPEGHPAKGAMRFTAFFSLDECRDLIMHVQEHRFTLPQIADCLDELGLQFLGFDCATEIMDGFRKMFPREIDATNLDAWHRFETDNPMTFTGMYVFWCRKKGAATKAGARERDPA